MQVWVRALILALALVVQTIASSAPAPAETSTGAGREHCLRMQGSTPVAPDKAGKSLPQTHAGCAHCALCGIDFGGVLAPLAPGFDVCRYSRLSPAASRATRIRGADARIASARGPPATI